MLSMRGVSKDFGGQVVLEDVELEVPEGEFLVIMGSNGAGKSTLLRILALVMRPNGGKLFYRGQEIVRDREMLYRKSIGYLAHRSFLYEDLSAWDNLLFYGRLYGVGDLEEKIEGWLVRTKLIRYSRDPVRVFSRGMQQRLALCRTLIGEPEVLFLDEPYTGLDPEGQDLLDEVLAGFEKTVVMVSHDLGKSEELADRIVVLEAGHLGGRDI